ncbi:MAG: hypothetical protein COA84_00805 [Robiginitomaculum sp.]|nr:MAG: hypothetical protein COA84_00805 [Robiginitomaculum sp.]
MIRLWLTLSTLCLMAWASFGYAQEVSPTCEQRAKAIDVLQQKIEDTRKAYDEIAKKVGARISLTNEAVKKKEDLSVLWADVLAAREEALPQAKLALGTLNTGFAQMQEFIAAGCAKTTASELEKRRKRSARHYEDNIKAMKNLPDDALTFYAPPPPPDPAICMALDEARKTAEAKAKAHSLKNDAKIMAYRKARAAVNNAIDFKRPFKKEWNTLVNARNETLQPTEEYIKLIRSLFEPVKEGLDNHCVQMSAQEESKYAKSTAKILKEVSTSYRAIKFMPLDREEYRLKRNLSTSARVAIVNKTSHILCFHLGDTAPGKCVIKPHGEKLVELPVNEKGEPNAPLIITGGVEWKKNNPEFPQVKSVSVCRKRMFEHKTGSKLWEITEGLDEDCTVPAPADE